MCVNHKYYKDGHGQRVFFFAMRGIQKSVDARKRRKDRRKGMKLEIDKRSMAIFPESQ